MVSTGIRPKQSGAVQPPPGTLGQAGVRRVDAAQSESASRNGISKPAGYGLPCAKCHLYYPADLDTCPTCHHQQRVPPIVPAQPPKRAETLPDPIPDSSAVEQEREEFLRQFKSQLIQVHQEVANSHASLCAFTDQHEGAESNAEICRACYERLQDRADVLEAALLIDAKKAAQIIYDAVWADPSDPSKTYENAATALLTELRRRAGISSAPAPFSPPSD